MGSPSPHVTVATPLDLDESTSSPDRRLDAQFTAAIIAYLPGDRAALARQPAVVSAISQSPSLTRLRPNVFHCRGARRPHPHPDATVGRHDAPGGHVEQVGVAGVFGTGNHNNRVVGLLKFTGGAMPLLHPWQGLR